MSNRKSLLEQQAELLLRIFRFRASAVNEHQRPNLVVQGIHCNGGMARTNPVLQLLLKQGHIKFHRRGGRTHMTPGRYHGQTRYCQPNMSGIKTTVVMLVEAPQAPHKLNCPSCSGSFVYVSPDSGKYRFKYDFHKPDCPLSVNHYR